MSFIGSMPLILTNSSYFALDLGSCSAFATASVPMSRWTSIATTPVVELGIILIRASPAAAPVLTPVAEAQDARTTVRKRTRPKIALFFMFGTSLKGSIESSGSVPKSSSLGLYHFWTSAGNARSIQGIGAGGRLGSRQGPGCRQDLFVINVGTRFRRFGIGQKGASHVGSNPSRRSHRHLPVDGLGPVCRRRGDPGRAQPQGAGRGL